ncbi:hypothetical protein BH11GEM1_BH11GEM1_36410 [soil metagenome]
MIYDGFIAAVAGGVPSEKAGILVDERFGAGILLDARGSGCITCASAARSGQVEFDVEFGEEFARHIEAFAPTVCKVLVRYNPEGDADMNRRQAARLRCLSEYLDGSPSRYMFELLVPATARQLEDVEADLRAYDQELRPALMVSAIRELQDAGVEPDVWKVEGIDRRADYQRIAAIARRDGRRDMGCIVLGRAENEQHVCTWLATAAAVPGFIGFAVGRTTFWDPLMALRDEKISREAAVLEIARRCRQWVDVFEQSQATMLRSDDSATGSGLQTT